MILGHLGNKRSEDRISSGHRIPLMSTACLIPEISSPQKISMAQLYTTTSDHLRQIHVLKTN